MKHPRKCRRVNAVQASLRTSTYHFAFVATLSAGLFVQAMALVASDENKVERRPAASPEVVRIDLSERGDPQFPKDLEKVRHLSQPTIVDLTWSKVGGDLLKKLHGLKNLQGLNLYGTDVSDKELQHLGELPDLEFIDLGGCNVTTEGILHLRLSRKMKRLGLAHIRPPIDDNAIMRLVSTWPNLESISLESSRITDVGLSHIGSLRHLRYLNVSRTKITDKGLKSLVGLPHLTTLHAGHNNITDRGMMYLGKLTSLEKLAINRTDITDRGLREVQGLANLKRIYFVGTKVTKDGLEYLRPLKSIEYVGASENISPEALNALKDSLPLFRTNKRG